jgi:hypothetical protein
MGEWGTKRVRRKRKRQASLTPKRGKCRRLKTGH